MYTVNSYRAINSYDNSPTLIYTLGCHLHYKWVEVSVSKYIYSINYHSSLATETRLHAGIFVFIDYDDEVSPLGYWTGNLNPSLCPEYWKDKCQQSAASSEYDV